MVHVKRRAAIPRQGGLDTSVNEQHARRARTRSAARGIMAAIPRGQTEEPKKNLSCVIGATVSTVSTASAPPNSPLELRNSRPCWHTSFLGLRYDAPHSCEQHTTNGYRGAGHHPKAARKNTQSTTTQNKKHKSSTALAQNRCAKTYRQQIVGGSFQTKALEPLSAQRIKTVDKIRPASPFGPLPRSTAVTVPSPRRHLNLLPGTGTAAAAADAAVLVISVPADQRPSLLLRSREPSSPPPP
ncbi:unnamed protein product, partial [Ectocarpus sp. 8 AP-2014]